MLHAVVGIFQLHFFTYFSTVVPLKSYFISCRPFVVNATFSTGLVEIEILKADSSKNLLNYVIAGQNDLMYKLLPSSVI